MGTVRLAPVRPFLGGVPTPRVPARSSRPRTLCTAPSGSVPDACAPAPGAPRGPDPGSAGGEAGGPADVLSPGQGARRRAPGPACPPLPVAPSRRAKGDPRVIPCRVRAGAGWRVRRPRAAPQKAPSGPAASPRPPPALLVRGLFPRVASAETAADGDRTGSGGGAGPAGAGLTARESDRRTRRPLPRERGGERAGLKVRGCRVRSRVSAPGFALASGSPYTVAPQFQLRACTDGCHRSVRSHPPCRPSRLVSGHRTFP